MTPVQSKGTYDMISNDSPPNIYTVYNVGSSIMMRIFPIHSQENTKYQNLFQYFRELVSFYRDAFNFLLMFEL